MFLFLHKDKVSTIKQEIEKLLVIINNLLGFILNIVFVPTKFEYNFNPTSFLPFSDLYIMLLADVDVHMTF